MRLDLDAAASAEPVWEDAPRYWADLTRAVEALPAPVAAVHLGALRHNALDLVVRAAGVPVRIATKSVRSRAILDAVLALPGYRGLLAYSLAEALWLAQSHDDIVLGYPTADRTALARLAGDPDAAAKITLMIDDEAQLDLIDAVASPAARPEIRLAIDVDASWRVPALGHVGVRRSPVHEPAEASRLARAVVARPGFRLVGVMMYEAQVAGVADAGSAAIRWMQRRSVAELRERRAAVVAAVAAWAPLEFVNAGGTGSLETSAADTAVTEVTAGSGLLAGHLFDGYRRFRPAPASAFAVDIVRMPTPGVVTASGGGWVASGPAGSSRLPTPVWPRGLHLLPREGAGEVQTPVAGRGTASLRVGSRVWFRHAKSGELCEHAERLQVVSEGRVVGEVSTYRGEGRLFA
ncbi:alanine racemase [Microbacterium aurantiacum]|uniref:Alanine racemase n=1 Tax=Microbacterium aurantiacum TaxID=162393 RepID=A0ABT8FSE5_9MICO|nr:alanine racemase [Microbacterium aurantiacum]MDN4464233.1 alanine racemase [Microbacterium aurantiacum]